MKLLEINMVDFLLGVIVVVLLLLVVFLYQKIKAAKENEADQPTAERKTVEAVVSRPEVVRAEGQPTAEESVAIAMALHLFYEEAHDVESGIMSIKTVERRYSPWSSKIYGLNNLYR